MNLIPDWLIKADAEFRKYDHLLYPPPPPKVMTPLERVSAAFAELVPVFQQVSKNISQALAPLGKLTN